MRAPSFSYAPGLDGVRALAVLSVFVYHLGTTSEADYLLGGFLGVDVFFVLSGYLITSLLLAEVAQSGRISVKTFYVRRARRLLPALYAMMLTVGVVVAVWLPQQAARMRGDLVASLFYVTNWWLIAQNDSYFGTGERPSLLTHLWSLAVEEQFYLIWPLLLALVVATARRGRSTRRYPLLLVLTVVLVVASAAVAVWLFDPWADPSRVYYGTDTRAATPLIGAVLAVVLRPWFRRPAEAAPVVGAGAGAGAGASDPASADTVVLPVFGSPGDETTVRLSPGSSPANHRRAGWFLRAVGALALDLLGLAGLAGLGVLAYGLSDVDPRLYQGGFLVIALLAAAVVASAGHPRSRFGRVLAVRPLRWLGERSYAVYLWHWPVCVLTRPGVDIPVTGWANTALRLAVTLALAELSHRLIEGPIRHGSLFRWRARPLLRLATAGMLSLLLAGGAAVGWQLNLVAGIEQARNPDGVPVGDDPPATLAPIVAVSRSPEAAQATRAPRTPPVSVALFGDSQGSALYANRPKDIGRYLKLSNKAVNACGIMRGRVVSRTGERLDLIASCPNWLSTWRSRAADARADIALVIVGAWDVFDLTTPDGTKLVFGTPQWDEHWLDQMRGGVAALRESGSQVALAELPCYRPVKIKGGGGYWPERGDDERTRHVNELMRQVADGVHVFTVRPAAAFCTDPAVGDNRKNRYDGIHFLRPGASVYLSAIIPQLLALPE